VRIHQITESKGKRTALPKFGYTANIIYYMQAHEQQLYSDFL